MVLNEREKEGDVQGLNWLKFKIRKVKQEWKETQMDEAKTLSKINTAGNSNIKEEWWRKATKPNKEAKCSMKILGGAQKLGAEGDRRWQKVTRKYRSHDIESKLNSWLYPYTFERLSGLQYAGFDA